MEGRKDGRMEEGKRGRMEEKRGFLGVESGWDVHRFLSNRVLKKKLDFYAKTCHQLGFYVGVIFFT